MIKIEHELNGLFAAPKDYPVTSGNPAPWKIHEIKIEGSFQEGLRIYIRGEHSMWFHSANCYLGDKEELEEMVQRKEEQYVIDRLSYQMIV